jgi:LuxR family maltose regulon positive regulatory protein
MSSVHPLMNTKIRTPRRRQNSLRRERLLNFIHSHVQCKLILVAAGAGYGKTSLIIDYAHDTDLPVCWYSLDTGDRRLETFVTYFVHSLRQRFPQFGQSILDFIDQTGDHGAEDIDLLSRLLVDAMEQSVRQYFVLVLDDYHEVIDSEPVNALVDGLLRYLPENCHIILASRGIPRHLTLTRLVARREVTGLGQEDLRFTPAEIYTLLHTMGDTSLTQEQTRILAERTEGWITGVLLAAQANWGGVAPDILRITGATGGVFAYMAEEILERQPSSLQRFLLGSALLAEMTPPLCDALLDVDNSAQTLRELEERNLFTFALDAEGNWYQYHQLFREFLLASFERNDPPGCRALRLRYAQIMANRGNWSRAVDSYLLAGAPSEAAEAIELAAQEIFNAGKWTVLRDWIDGLPQDVVDRHPRLLFFRARVYTEMGLLTQASALFDRAQRCYLEREDRIGAARAMVQNGVVQRLRGRLREALQTCSAVLQMVEELDGFTAMQARRNIGICYAMLGRVSEGVGELQAGLGLAEANADETNAAQIAHDMGVMEMMRGQLASAQNQYRRALGYWRKVGNASALASTLQSLGVVHHHLGQYAESEARFQEALSRAREVADTRVEAYALASQGDLYRDMRRYAEARASYVPALDLASANEDSRLVIYLLDALGNTYRLQGDLAQARQWLAEAASQVREDEMSYEAGLSELSQGILAWQQGSVESAQARLSQACTHFASSEAKRELARTNLYLAACAQSMGQDAEVVAYLGRVVHLGAELGTQQFIQAEAPSLESLILYAEERGVPGLDYVRMRPGVDHATLSARTAVGAPALAISEGPQPSVVRTSTFEFLALDGGRILRDGQPATDWESSAARVMAFLFAMHPNGLARERVIDLLWPEVTPAKGNSLFHSSMYRLRGALAKDIIVHSRGIYRLSPSFSYYYDVAEFECLASRGQGDGEDAQSARQQAMQLYRTPFLEICDGEWCLEVRQRLRQQLLDLLILEGRALALAGRFHESESCYLRALSLDSFDERAHRGIIWCRASASDRAGALRQFRECTRILGEELGVEPSPDTLALHKAILANTLLPLHT